MSNAILHKSMILCGYPIISSVHTAAAHRHVTSALGFIVEGNHTYMAANGERTMMLSGEAGDETV